jgi:hypothetical protein
MCDCIAKVDEQLKDRGLQLTRVFSLGAGRIGESVPLHTTRLDNGRKGKLIIFPTYCPFCGASMQPKRKRSTTTAANPNEPATTT